MVCLPGEGTIHVSTNCPKIINIGESTPLEVVWIGCELTTSNFQPKRSSFECAPPDQAKQQGMRMLTTVHKQDESPVRAGGWLEERLEAHRDGDDAGLEHTG